MVLALSVMGIYKGYGLFYFPLIFTYIVQALLIVILIDIFLSILNNTYKFSYNYGYCLFFLIIFYIIIIISLIYSPSQDYKYIKTLNFTIPLILYAYAPLLSKINFDRLTYPYMILLLPIIFLVVSFKNSILNIDMMNNENQELFDYLGLGTGVSIVVILLNYFKKSIAVQIFMLSTLLMMGARGPLIFAVLLIFFMNFRAFFNDKLFTIILPLGIMGILITSYFDPTETVFMYGIDRMADMDGSSNFKRLQMFQFAMFANGDSIFNIFFGRGIGSFGISYAGEDVRAYPHNILLEIFFELGIIGLLIFFAILVIALEPIIRGKNVFVWIFILLFLNSLKSSSLTDHWLMFMYLGLLLNSKSRTLTYNGGKKKT
tara:strand:- start:59 stop:1180 length:1122 start_codon:yes stop_codon:yes gene_type:complete